MVKEMSSFAKRKNGLVEGVVRRESDGESGPKGEEVSLDYAVNRVGDILPEGFVLVMEMRKGSMVAWLEDNGVKVPAIMELSDETPAELVMRLLNQAIRKHSLTLEVERLKRRRAKEKNRKRVT